eukprot:TRINITY_DN5153_c5_g1_i1.p2 TRINITY_DN5153_c5_g1~~TRINITY_DN5153_c5_g1_i1.p2  ORF type:complete len:283 (+),score=80.85 TRINITY_DN5153_c5_g1_i1:94-942(+)
MSGRGMVRCTQPLYARPFNPFARTDHPGLHHSITELWQKSRSYRRALRLMPTPLLGHSRTGLDERYTAYGYEVMGGWKYKWPKRLLEQRGGRMGWDRPPREDAFATYRQHMEQMHETGVLAKPLGEFGPENIMQTWFGKRVQTRRILTWSDSRTQKRIHPHIYGWVPEVASVPVYSELLEHQFRPAIDHDALALMESYGGIDQWVLQNDPMYLQSWEMEKVRNYLLVRRMEMDKNHVMEEQAQALAAHLFQKLKAQHAKRVAGGGGGAAPEPAEAESSAETI